MSDDDHGGQSHARPAKRVSFSGRAATEIWMTCDVAPVNKLCTIAAHEAHPMVGLHGLALAGYPRPR